MLFKAGKYEVTSLGESSLMRKDVISHLLFIFKFQIALIWRLQFKSLFVHYQHSEFIAERSLFSDV